VTTTPTSPTGDVRPRAGTQAGFTLLELLVVLVIMAIAIAIVPPLLSRTRDRAEIRTAVSTLVSQLRLARAQAIGSDGVRDVAIMLSDKTFGLVGGRAYSFPSDVALAVTSAENLSGGGVARVRFFPNGGSSGGTIDLDAGSVVYHLTVNWLTGRVRVEEQGGGA
jgi:general secretion pathway protein H